MQSRLQCKSNKYDVFRGGVCSLRHPGRNAHEHYFIFLCGLPGSTIFSHVIFFRKKNYLPLNACFDFLYSCCLKYFSFYDELCEILLKICTGLHVKYPLLMSDFNESSSTIFDKTSSTKFHENPSSGRSTRTDRHDEANSRFSKFCDRP